MDGPKGQKRIARTHHTSCMFGDRFSLCEQTQGPVRGDAPDGTAVAGGLKSLVVIRLSVHVLASSHKDHFECQQVLATGSLRVRFSSCCQRLSAQGPRGSGRDDRHGTHHPVIHIVGLPQDGSFLSVVGCACLFTQTCMRHSSAKHRTLGISLARGRTRMQHSTVCVRRSRQSASLWSGPGQILRKAWGSQQPRQFDQVRKGVM